MRKVILYIVYGADRGYYDEAKFSLLTFKYWSKEKNIQLVVLTEKPEEFSDYQVDIITMPQVKKNEWSLDGKYHFRIKNRGLAYAMDKLNLKDKDKIIFFDTDTYFHKSPLPLFDLILPNQALLYINEGFIYKRKRFNVYVRNLEGERIEINNDFYELSKKSSLWGSLMIGIMPKMRHSLDWADSLMLKFYEMVPAHTIEEFSLSETLSKNYKLAEGKKFVSLYSTSRKKAFAREALSYFFQSTELLRLEDKINLAQKVKIKRPFFVILKQRYLRIFNK